MMVSPSPAASLLEVHLAASASRVTTLFLVLIAQQVLVLAQQPPANRPLEGTYWKATELGGKPTPRAQCPPGSLHDQIVKQWTNIRSYVVKDAHRRPEEID